MSHPTRVRGLKLRGYSLIVTPKKSHPTRVRGLKRGCIYNAKAAGLSHPTRVRGLKLYHVVYDIRHTVVAPYAGAWIETESRIILFRPFFVAPYAGAWIETSRGYVKARNMSSHPTRVRGLKLQSSKGKPVGI